MNAELCQHFWRNLVSKWIKFGLGEINKNSLSSTIEYLKTQGWEGGPLEEWSPKPHESYLLKDAHMLLGYIENPFMAEQKRLEYYQKFCGLVRQIKQHGPELIKIADLLILSRLGKKAEPLGLSLPSGFLKPQEKSTPQQISYESLSLAYSRPGEFAIKSGVASVYIDEVGIGTEFGAIAGIVWDGHAPVETMLPFVNTHSKNPTLLNTLLSCEHAFPFILPLQNSPGRPSAKYEEIVVCALQLLLGWLISPRPPKTIVNVFLEQYSGYTPGKKWTGYLHGRFDEAASWFENRFAGWEINRCGWYPKNHGYIAWGDLLGYWYLKQSWGEAFGSIPHSRLPGFVPLTVELVGRLKRLEFLEKTGCVGDILDLADSITGTVLFQTILADMKMRFSNRKELQERLVEELDARYQKKERNLRSLQRMAKALRTLIPDNRENMPLRMRLTLLGVDLQEANHAGDPLRIEDVSLLYEKEREKGLECDRELVAYVDANLAVHYADTFDFAQAKAIMERTVSDPYFGGLGLSARGRAWSGLGQYHSIEKNYEQAEHLFQKAIDAFQKDPGLSEEKRQGEIDQTSVYRAINAMDGRFPNAEDLVQQVLGDIVSAEKTLAPSSLQAYHHHLLLRSFYDLQPEDALPKDLPRPLLEAKNSYLSLHAQWKSTEQHPWPLIEMYRGILWWKQGNPAESKKRFYQAIDVATARSHGHVLCLIAAMISAVGFCCHQDDIWREAAEKCMQKVEEGLPKTKDAVRQLRQAMDHPGEEGIRQALGALPFNYH